MNIAVFADNFYPELSGIADSISMTARELGRRGHTVDIYVPRYAPAQYAIAHASQEEPDLGENVYIVRLSSLPFPTSTRQGRVVFPFLRVQPRQKYDVIHTHSFFGPGVIARRMARQMGVPLIGTNHTLIESFVPKHVGRLFSRSLIRFFNRTAFVTSPSKFLIDDMQQKGLRVSTRAVSNPIATGFFQARVEKEVLRKELGLPGFTFMYAGRMSADKNIGVLVEAFARFSKTHPQSELVLIGEGSTRGELEERARELGCTDRIHFRGPYLGNNLQTLYDYFHAADALVMPSTSETQSMVTIQAMAAGLPVIAARAGALPEMVPPNRGVLFEPSDTDGLVSCLVEAYENPKDELRIQHARVFAKDFSPETVTDIWEDIYRSR